MELSPMNKQVERGPRGRVLCASYIVKKGVGEAWTRIPSPQESMWNHHQEKLSSSRFNFTYKTSPSRTSSGNTMKKKLFYAKTETWASPTELLVTTCDIKSLQKHNDACRKKDKCKTRALEVVTTFKEGPLSFNYLDFGAGWIVLTANLKTNATCALDSWELA